MWNENDKKLMAAKGITESVIEAQLKRFETGFPWLKLEAAATVGKGIMRLDAKQQAQCIKLWKDFQGGGASIEKFQAKFSDFLSEPFIFHSGDVKVSKGIKCLPLYMISCL